MTSPTHSLNPALYLPRNDGSVVTAAEEKRVRLIKIQTYSKIRNKFVKKVTLKCGESTSLSHTSHLKSLKIPEVFHCHLQNVCLFQFRVSGALKDKQDILI